MMKELANNRIDSILNAVAYDVASGKRLIVFVKMLGHGGLPNDVQAEMHKLAEFIERKEMFNALIELFSSFAKKAESMPTGWQITPSEIDFEQLFQQLSDARKKIAECETVNYPLITSWMASQAKNSMTAGCGKTS